MKKSLGAQTNALPTPVWLVGSYDRDGKPNIATIAWGGICSSGPPSVTISLRPSRYSYEAIMERKAFTVSIPSTAQVVPADYAGMASGKNADKFAVAGLTPVRSELVDAPYVAECPLVLECRLLKTVELGVHTQFIGEIVDTKVDQELLGPDGLIDAAKVSPLVYAPGSRLYYGLGEVVGKGFAAGRELMPGAGDTSHG